MNRYANGDVVVKGRMDGGIMRILTVGLLIRQGLLSEGIPIYCEEPVPDPEWSELMKSEKPVRKLKKVGYRTNKWEF